MRDPAAVRPAYVAFLIAGLIVGAFQVYSTFFADSEEWLGMLLYAAVACVLCVLFGTVVGVLAGDRRLLLLTACTAALILAQLGHFQWIPFLWIEAGTMDWVARAYAAILIVGSLAGLRARPGAGAASI